MNTSRLGPREFAMIGLALSIVLLIPGLIAPVITVRGTLDPDGVAELAPKLLDQGISDDAINSLKPMLNPMLVPLLELSPGGLKGALVGNLGAQLGEQLRGGPPIEVYTQTRSILGSVKQLYSVGSGIAATLILVFSVIVPFTKTSLVFWALFHTGRAAREQTVQFVERIAKWSMADVFAVALIIAFLAAQASQSPSTDPDAAAAVVRFDADFGAGFYWFAAYCLFSLAVQQWTARWVMSSGAPTAARA